MAAVREALAPLIVQNINGLESELQVITLSPKLEQLLLQSVQAGADPGIGLEPSLAEALQRGMRESTQRQEAVNRPAVLLVSQTLRSALARLARQLVPTLRVLAWNEIPDDKDVRIVATVGGAE
jgi:flagellar biosynthesis protein FlhA